MMVFLDASGRSVGRVELTCHTNGNLIEKRGFSPPRRIEGAWAKPTRGLRAVFGTTRRTHHYDENGHRVETHSQLGLLGDGEGKCEPIGKPDSLRLRRARQLGDEKGWKPRQRGHGFRRHQRWTALYHLFWVNLREQIR
jgi:hypothetical protein